MAAEVAALPQIRQEAGPAPLTADQAYWKSFKNQQLIPSPHSGAVTSITTGASDTFAVTSGARAQIYNSRSRKLVKTISRFNVDDTARSAVLRRDGRILLAGGDSGIVQAFDTGSRAILRQWGHDDKRRQPIHCVRWSPSELTAFLTCGDDRTVRVWDLTEDEPKWIGRAHEDYVRCGCWLPQQDGMLVSGSYDQTVRLWDSRRPGPTQPAMTFSLKSAVEDVLALGPSTVAAAAGNTVAILNLIAGKPDVILRSHQKSVTRLATAQNGSRLLTAGLDGHIKVHSTESWEVVASIKYTAPILSLAVISSGNEERHLAVGLQTGLLSLRTRLAGAEKVKAKEKEKRMQAMIEGTADEYDRLRKKKDLRQGIRARDRGKDFRGEGADIVIVGNDNRHAKKLTGWQKSLRSGLYSKALDEVLTPQTGRSKPDIVNVVTLVTALRHRSALRTALAGRSEEQLIPIAEWILLNINHPRFLPLITDVLLLFLDLYSYRFADWEDGESEDGRKLVSLFSRISARVRRGVEVAEKAEGLVGIMSLLTAG
ncbi:hypothetical protein AMS68_001177 [Peltaster fructicola]|uniref:U3 small nucleolar RNA-associated protein 15 C-terminal domain-containing protein n=1 Tax=Peltaster fructicola TaxID=286661 RepID=A0A6H0XMD6_9PEZI|nr:hypothetical protein AMS68_001177 [Peltaster fructicola]